jgi:hypothetical protein
MAELMCGTLRDDALLRCMMAGDRLRLCELPLRLAARQSQEHGHYCAARNEDFDQHIWPSTPKSPKGSCANKAFHCAPPAV